MSVTKADVINRFNAIVHAGMSPAANTAVAWSGNVPGSPSPLITNHADLGDRNEPAKTVGDIPPVADKGVVMANSIFNILHNFAMEYTRVRQARWAYFNATTVTEGPWQLTALKPSFALYFPLPASSQPLPGEPITLSDLDDFLEDLKNLLNQRRTNTAYGHLYAHLSCHSSCHSSCHGSRGRR